MIASLVVVLSDVAEFKARAQKMAEAAKYTTLNFNNADELMSDVDHNLDKTEFLILDASTAAIQNDIIGMVQVARQFCMNAFIMVVLGGKTSPEVTVFVKKSGANAVLLDNEFMYSSKPEYIWTQAVKSPYFAVKANSLRAGMIMEQDLLHFMPMNRKFIKVVAKGSELTDAKLAKMNEVGEFYVHKDDIDAFIAFINTKMDMSAAGLSQRCRLQFQKLNLAFTHLVLLLSDQSEYASFSEGKKLFEQCLKSTEDLLTNLSAVGDPWEIVDNASFGGYGTVDRAASIAAYAGLLSLRSGIGKTTDCMIGALMADVGMLDISPTAAAKLRSGNESKFNAEEKNEYEKHMIYSLNQCLSRRVPLSENLKNIILCTHERADGKGFPNQPRLEKIPLEAFIIQFCERFDRMTVIQEGRERPKLNELKLQIFQDSWKAGDVFSMTFLSQIKKGFLGDV